MSSLRRHFHFGLSKPSSTPPHLGSPLHGLSKGSGLSPSGCVINRDIFLNDFSNCVEMITNFVQSLNSLCNAGTVLGQSFLQVFKEIPSSYDVALQFQNVWEDASKATAGASADVKTETLFLLQDVLNKLDLEGDCLQECSPVVAECRQALGICLLAYTELQVYFSLFIWKSLNTVCRNLATNEFLSMYTSGSVIAGSRGINGYFGLKSNTLSSSIRKHFAHLLQKCDKLAPSNPTEGSETQCGSFFAERMDREGSLGPVPEGAPETNSPLSGNLLWAPDPVFAQNVCSADSMASSSWTMASTFPKSTNPSSASASPSKTVHTMASSQAVLAGSKPQVPNLLTKVSSRNGVLDIPTELESVICLLSCKTSKNAEAEKPVTAASDKALLRRAVGQPWTDIQESCASLTALGASVPSGCGSQSSDATRTWPRVGTNTSLPNFRSDPCFWRGSPFTTQFSTSMCNQGTDGQKPSSSEEPKDELRASWGLLNQEKWQTNKLSSNLSSDEENSNGQEVDFLKLLVDSKQRRHSASSDWLSEVSSVPDMTKELDSLWGTRVGKTSTWPLKMSSRTPEPILRNTSPIDSTLNLSSVNQMWNITENPVSEIPTDKEMKETTHKYSLFGQS